MRKKHPDRTDEWDQQQRALKKIYVGTILPDKTKEDKKANH